MGQWAEDALAYAERRAEASTPLYDTASQWGLTGQKCPVCHEPFRAHHKVDEADGTDAYFKHVACKVNRKRD